ncbi:3-keto-disaccharide hydrolase [Gilvimarinus algae]|uniref:DUF1080 domain-containing protein n=1 Tax=Gilvimarinus algae TaxID=3058037 RepID=A0ABT8TH92_9GAMM|nr:DUF1080 domain-containing protein [Gilvimarinus sp. SDUM040014]MDO3382748.1 DUF1080 domain-containing protein [Gilvimarinus sp. SDUM040014]
MKLSSVLTQLIGMSAALVAVSPLAAEKEPWQLAQETEVWEPVPEKVSVNHRGVPSDAVVLFDGSGLDAWESVNDGSKAPWKILGDELVTNPKTGDIRTRQDFCDLQLHIEWQAPAEAEMEGPEGQGRGNSGVFFQERYEVQVLDSFGGETYPNGQAGSIYKQHIPLVNATKPLSEWNVYDIIYTAPRFSDSGELEKPAYITVLHNGVLVQNHAEVQGPTAWIGHPPYEAHGCAPLRLQDHGNPTKFRNIWIREL